MREGDEDPAFEAAVASELAELPDVLAVTLGGSRAQGTHRPDSDWDFAIYYRRSFDPDVLRAKGWEGQVFDVGGWGGGVMNGGAWLTIDGRRVDVHYRDLEDVERRAAEARDGRFEKEHLLFHIAGIPTYVLLAELAVNRVLYGTLPVPEFPDALAEKAGHRWHEDALLSLGYGESVAHHGGDSTVAMANGVRGLLEEAHARMAASKRWVLNEKGLVDDAGLGDEAGLLLAAGSDGALATALGELRLRLSS